jgi:mannosyltransferase
MSARGRRWALAVVVGLAFALRVIGLDGQSLWRDEVDAIRFAQFPLPDLLRTFVTPGQNGPLYFLLLRPWLGLAGQSEFALRFLSVFFGVLAVLLTYRLARGLFAPLPQAQRDGASFLAAILAATSPYLVWYGQEGKMYSLVVALALTAITCYLAALRQGRWYHWLGYVAATTAAFYVHLIAALLIPVQVLIFALGSWNRRACWKPWLASLAALTLPYLLPLRWQLPALLHVADTGYRFFPLDEMLLSLAADYSLGVAPQVTIWAVVFFVALLAAGVFLFVRVPRTGLRRTTLWVLLCWLFVPLLAFFLITLRRPMFTTRYLIFVLPAYLLLLAAGVVAVGRRSRPLAVLSLAALLGLNGLGLWAQTHTPLKTDFRAATYHVIDRLAPGDLVLFQIPYGRHSFDYYVERWSDLHSGTLPPTFASPAVGTSDSGSYHWAEGLYTNAGMTPGEAAQQMADLTAGSPVVWLVATETSMWDMRGLVQSWLDEHATLADQAEFTRVTVYHYTMPSR